MDVFELVVLAAALAAPLYFLTRLERDRVNDPQYVRRCGGVVSRERLRLGDAPVIGTYDGSPIYAQIEYLGIRYRFDRAMPPSSGFRPGAGELYVDPGLVYVTD